ncbi:hypothetical protein IW261DRAFT_1577455 [Armillaria novae-zelandiae]|uniref:Uncharacterized protein n=1 Tax=Armillaria novae-zelandiae TaxID=153914 RepID=A0AA39N849_9AGAR|nr:hypothetical protein IW261DRAFT_1577455 [Armillaria novae-zelandiae]
MTPIRTPRSRPSKSTTSSPSKSSPTSPGAVKINKLLKDELQSIARSLSPNPHSTSRRFTCPLSEPPSRCRGVIHMYHGGFSDEPVCGISHPMFVNLGRFYTFCNTHHRFGEFISDPLPEECLVASQTIRNLLNDRAQCVRRRELANKSPSSSSSSSPAHHIKGEKQDIYNTSQSRLSSSSTLSLPRNRQKKTDIACDATSPGPHQGRVSVSLSNRSGAKSATTEIIDISDDESCGALALEAVFWTKSARSPTIIPLDDRNTTIGEILGVFDDGRSYLELFLPETLTWVPVDLTTVIVLHRGDCIALKTRHVEDLKDWGLYVHNLEDSFLEYIVKD